MIIVASNNKGKIKEFNSILSDFKLVSLKEQGIDIDIEEDGTSYQENAFIKANTIFNLTKCSVVADDSGLEIEALNNFPGIFTARYASDVKDYKDRCQMLLDKMKGLTNRKAKFVAAIILIDNEGNRYEGYGECSGKISENYAGGNGFGFDPIFIPDGYDKTMGELSDEEKNAISHRFKALIDLKKKLPLRFIRRQKND